MTNSREKSSDKLDFWSFCFEDILSLEFEKYLSALKKTFKEGIKHLYPSSPQIMMGWLEKEKQNTKL